MAEKEQDKNKSKIASVAGHALVLVEGLRADKPIRGHESKLSADEKTRAEQGTDVGNSDHEYETYSDEVRNVGNNQMFIPKKDGKVSESIRSDHTIVYAREASTDDGDRLSKVLTVLNLTEKFPEGFTRSDMYRITKSSLFDEQPKCHGDLAKYFLENIAKYNYTAREFHIAEGGQDHISPSIQTGKKSKFRQKMDKREEENKVIEVSPMDVIIAVFLCCDDICKQDLVSHMWSCRLAVPLIIQEKAIPSLPYCYLWPLRSLVMKWEADIKGQICIREGRLVKESVTSIAFIRFGEVGLSKSALINSVISASEKTHSIFMHRDSPGYTRHRYLVKGLIDVGWYFPTPKADTKRHDSFEDAVMFLNLHGDASELKSQLKLLLDLANTIVVLCKVKDLYGCRSILKSYLDGGKTLLAMLTDQEINPEDENVIDNCMDYLEVDDNQLEFVEVGNKTKAELVRETRSILRKLSDGKSVCLEDVFSSNIHVVIDEEKRDLLAAKKMAQAISNLVCTTPYQDRKRLHLPLQGEPWIRWAIADKEMRRPTNKRRNENLDAYIAERKKIMNECRLKQVNILQRKGSHKILHLFLKSISTAHAKERKLFVRFLKFDLDDLSRIELRPVFKRYQEIMKSLAMVGEQNKGALKIELEKLDQEVALLSFGLEHMLREMGQMYEALMFQRRSPNPIAKYNLPELAAKILLDGYPLELLDGHVNSVPLLWVKAVLKMVQRILTRKSDVKVVRTKVISALGIQSSGKSTMLNALFGCQYAVSAGRCTRGVYCQFIEVDENYRREAGTDFLLAIDTEGLRAPELSANDQMVKHDNELSTFVIGLADITILNLMGENTTYLDELLPISVHAFLRMEMATDFKPKCVIVHQNVNKEDDEKLLQQGRILEKKLNEMTEFACNVERVETKSFANVIDFDVSKDVFYLTALLEGIQPMAPVSIRYSEELNVFKRKLIMKDDNKAPKSLDLFILHLDILWQNIKKDDFVYQFRNTIETEARSKLDDYWCDANWTFRQPVNEMISTSYVKIQNCSNTAELKSLVKSLETHLKGDVDKEYQKQRHAFENFIEEADTLMKETMMRWSVDMDKRFDDLRADLIRETLAKIKEFEQDKQRELSLRKDMMGYQNKLKVEVQKLVSVVKSSEHKPVSEDDILNFFEGYWRQWKSQILEENPRLETDINITDDAYEAISRAFPSGRDALTEYLQMKPLQKYERRDFKSKEIISTTSRLVDFFGLSKAKKEVEDLAKDIFHKVDTKLDSRGRVVRPYTQADIVDTVMLVQKQLHCKRKTINMKVKHEVYLAVITCGDAIQRLTKFHKIYESQNNPGNFLENEKAHYVRIFRSLFNEAETSSLLASNFQEILKRGILEKMTRTLPGKICISMRLASFTLTSKSTAILELLVELATNGTFKDFETFIRRPERGIFHFLSKRTEDYSNKEDSPIHNIFIAILNHINEEISLILEKTCQDGKESFQTWLEIFRRNTTGVIVLENIDGLKELGKGKKIDLSLFFENVKAVMSNVVSEICKEMISYLAENWKTFKKQVVEEIMKTIIGCTQNCPFCGAICMVAHANHSGEHYTTLHRPQGCKGWHKRGTKLLITRTCPMSVALPDKRFFYMKNEEEHKCLYKDYKTIYPDWKITSDETGEETSFWNWFFSEYAEQIAGDDLKVPDIPLSWRELDRYAEINKLQEKMSK